MEQEFLPICREDMRRRGITQLDFVYVIGDAYVDHPSFGHAIISRLLEAHGYYFPARLETERQHRDLWGAKAGIFNQRWEYGFYGESLQCFQTPPGAGCLHPGRGYGETSGLCNYCLWESNPPDL